MLNIKLNDVSKVFPFIKVSGLFDRKEKRKILEKQKEAPYQSNEGVIAVQHFSLDISSGQFVVLVGPSGSGKSTVLRMIAGLEDPTVGEILFNDEVINSVKPEDRDIAMVFQNYSLYPNQTVYENIAFPLKNQHMIRDELDARVKEIADLLRIGTKLERLPNQLSGGEKQRVAIARALVRKPKLFLLDEPFSNLDGPMRASLRKEIKHIQKELGITFIHVTHDQSEALYLADQLVVMNEGKIVQKGETAEVYNHPVNSFVATFLGSPTMNMFNDVPISKKGNDWSFNLFGKDYPLSGNQKKMLKKADCLTVGIRGVNVSLAHKGIEATIDYTEMIGGDVLIYLLVGEQSLVAVERFNEEKFYVKDDLIHINFQDDYFYLFDKEGNYIGE